MSLGNVEKGRKRRWKKRTMRFLQTNYDKVARKVKKVCIKSHDP